MGVNWTHLILDKYQWRENVNMAVCVSWFHKCVKFLVQLSMHLIFKKDVLQCYLNARLVTKRILVLGSASSENDFTSLTA